VSSFRTEDRADAVSNILTALGLPVGRRVANGYQQVFVGPYKSRAEAVAARAKLEDRFPQTVITAGSASPSAASSPAAAPRAAPAGGAPATTGSAPSAAASPATRPPAAPPAPLMPLPDNAPIADVLERASTLAAQPNVRALQQLRDQVARRQSAATGANASQLQSALDQVDKHLNAARQRQLEDDARRFGGGAPPNR
jgi:hypothetical protein